METKFSSSGSNVLERATQVLEAVLAHPQGVRLQQVSETTRLPLSTVSRLLGNWERLGYLSRNGAYFEAGPQIYRWHALLPRHSMLSLGRQFLEMVAAWCNETLNLAIRSGNRVVFLDQMPSGETVQVRIRPGDTAPGHCVATGLVLLSALPEKTLYQLYRGGFETPQPHSIGSWDALTRRLAQIRDIGYATCQEELEPGLASVAIGLPSAGIDTLCAVGVAGPAFRLTPERQQAIGEQLLECRRTFEQSTCEPIH